MKSDESAAVLVAPQEEEEEGEPVAKEFRDSFAIGGTRNAVQLLGGLLRHLDRQGRLR